MNRKTYTFTIQMQLNKWTWTQKQDDADINDARRRFRIYILKKQAQFGWNAAEGW